ncbi:hypothetical protein O0L34_g10328 [Tuta absoluta]|nr:hypothetical protein O0L34_g10328 [Tuta absoluta]
MKTVSPAKAILILALSVAVFAGVNSVQESESETGDNTVFDQDSEDFGFPFKNDPLLSSSILLLNFFKPLPVLTALPKHVASNVNTADIGTIITEDDKYLIRLNVKNFAPEDISVNAVNGTVVIRADHKDKGNNKAFSARQFVSRYMLPDSSNSEEISTEIKNGVLIVSIPRKVPEKTKLATI